MTRPIPDPAVPLDLRGVTYAYPGAPAPAVRDLSLACAPGEVVGLIGPNGAGKSTLLRLAAGLLAPAAGSVRVDGLDPARTPRRRVARHVAFVPAALAVGFPLAVRDLVALGRTAHLKGLFESAVDRAAVANALATAEATALADRAYGELSAGEQRRVLLARALAQEPRLLLLDEPTANLDIAHAVSVLARVARLARSSGVAVLAAIHDLNAALLVCDRIVLLRDGAVLAAGEPEEVMRWTTLRETFGCDLYIGRNEVNGRLFVVPMGEGATGRQAGREADPDAGRSPPGVTGVTGTSSPPRGRSS